MTGFILAIDIGGTKLALATADLDGAALLSRAEIATAAELGADQALERAAECAATLLVQTGERHGAGPCRGFAVVAPGVLRDGTMVLTPNVPGLDHLNLRAVLEDRLDIPCLSMSNDVKAAALAEARSGSLHGCDPALYVNLGTGIAAAVVVSGRVVGGAHGAAGEIAYLLEGDPGQATVAGGDAPLEELVGGRAIARQATALLGRSVTTAEAFADDDPRVQRLVDEALATVGRHVANAAVLLDPQRVALGGGLMGSPGRVIEVVTRRVTASVPFPPEVVPAAFLRDAPLRGALALAVDALQAEMAS